MSCSVEKTLCFLVICLLFFQTKSQVISKTKAEEGTLKHLVHLTVYTTFLNQDKDEQFSSVGVSGSLIKLNWILTAAHNVEDDDVTVNGITRRHFFFQVNVLAGSKNSKKETPQQCTIYESDIIIHEEYNRNDDYDVALLYMKNKFQITDTVEPAKLLEPGMDFDADAKCVIQGWGYNELVYNKKNQLVYPSDQPKHAMQGFVNILNGEKCASKYNVNGRRRFNSYLNLCYGCNNGTCEQTTKGDSGTPIVCALEKGDNPLINGVVVAVHSFGCKDVSEKCFPNGPSAGVDVRKIKDWIELETMKRGDRTGVNQSSASIYPYLIAAAVVIVLKYFY